MPNIIDPSPYLALIPDMLRKLRIVEQLRDDASQAAALALCDAARRWTAHAPPTVAWAQRRIKWAVLDHLRDEAKSAHITWNDEAEEYAASPSLTPAGTVFDPNEFALTALQQSVLALRTAGGIDNRTAAASLGVSLSTYMRALRALKKKIENAGDV